MLPKAQSTVEALRRQLHRGDHLAGVEIGLALRRVAWQPVKIVKRDHSLTGRIGDMNLGLQHGQRHAHVGGMRRDAGVARAKYCVHAVMPVGSGAAGAHLAFIAGRCRVVEVMAARALQEVATGRRHVAQLLRGAGHDRACKDQIAVLDQWVIGEIGVAHQGADAQTAVRSAFDLVQRQPVNVDHLCGAFDIHLHQVDKIGAAGDEFCRRIARELTHRVRNIAGARIFEVDHDRPIACWIAATMLV
jgi:hypothetical protein